MTMILLLTLITGQQIEIEAPKEGCQMAVEQFKAGAPGYFEFDGVSVKIVNMTCKVTP